MKEEWRPVIGWEGLYEASNKGRVRSVSHEALTPTGGRYRTKPQIKKSSLFKGRDTITLVRNQKRHKIQVARLIALAWIDGYEEGMTVDHIDGNKRNNSLSNLRWLSRSDNTSESYKTVDRCHHIPVELINAAGETLHFKNEYEADRFLGRCPGYIDSVLRKCPNPRAHSKDGKYYEITLRKGAYNHA